MIKHVLWLQLWIYGRPVSSFSPFWVDAIRFSEPMMTWLHSHRSLASWEVRKSANQPRHMVSQCLYIWYSWGNAEPIDKFTGILLLKVKSQIVCLEHVKIVELNKSTLIHVLFFCWNFGDLSFFCYVFFFSTYDQIFISRKTFALSPR